MRIVVAQADNRHDSMDECLKLPAALNRGNGSILTLKTPYVKHRILHKCMQRICRIIYQDEVWHYLPGK